MDRQAEREDQQLDLVLTRIEERCNDLNNSIGSLICKLESEYELLNWNSFLESFALISGQLSSLMKIVQHEKTPAFRERILLPLLLLPDRDEQLAQMTKGRVQTFNHDMCPLYLRTKFDPEIAAKRKDFQDRLSKLDDISLKQINSFNKIVSNILESIREAREKWDADATKGLGAINQNSSASDTQSILAAINQGKGILEPLMPAKPSAQQQMSSQTSSGPAARGGKMPGSIKTNIKAANSSNSYGR